MLVNSIIVFFEYLVKVKNCIFGKGRKKVDTRVTVRSYRFVSNKLIKLTPSGKDCEEWIKEGEEWTQRTRGNSSESL